eukprot:151059_1
MNKVTTEVTTTSESVELICFQQYPLLFNDGWKHIYCDKILPIKDKTSKESINVQNDENLFTELKDFLKKSRLQKYLNALIEQGVESLDDLHDLNTEEIGDIATDAKMKRVHKKQFIKMVQQLQTEQHANNDMDANNDYDVIKQQMQKYILEQKTISDEINTALNLKNLPLHKFTSKNIADKIKYWIYHDINYKSGLLETMRIFSNHSLSGHSISVLTADNAKRIVKNDLLQLTFMTSDSLDIIFDTFDRWKSENNNEVRTKSAPEIAYIVYHYPLRQLLTAITENDVNGEVFIQKFENHTQLIRKNTGWKSQDIYQINAILFKHSTPSAFDLMNNINIAVNDISKQRQLLPKVIQQKIKQRISEFNVETMYYKIKQNEHIEEFSDATINMVDDIIEYNDKNKQNNQQDAYFEDDLVSRIYEVIANCFISLVPNTNAITLHTKHEWICHNC